MAYGRALGEDDVFGTRKNSVVIFSPKDTIKDTYKDHR